MFYKERIDFFVYFQKQDIKIFHITPPNIQLFYFYLRNKKNELYINTARYYMIFISLCLKYNFYIKLIHF